MLNLPSKKDIKLHTDAKAIQFLMFCCLISTGLFGQSSVAATASVTIIKPVGTENFEERRSEIFLREQPTELNQYNIASIKLWNNEYAFNVMVPSTITFTAGNKESILMEEVVGKISTDNRSMNLSTITIAGSLNLDKKVPGNYTSPEPLQVMIMFE